MTMTQPQPPSGGSGTSSWSSSWPSWSPVLEPILIITGRLLSSSAWLLSSIGLQGSAAGLEISNHSKKTKWRVTSVRLD